MSLFPLTTLLGAVPGASAVKGPSDVDITVVTQDSRSARPGALFVVVKGTKADGSLYVKDAIRMTLHLAETASAGGLFNLGSGEAHTWVELDEQPSWIDAGRRTMTSVGLGNGATTGVGSLPHRDGG